jgi:PAS domain S-box-containing protein
MENKKILIVDDEPNIITLFRYMLEKEGYEVSSVIDGEKALNKLKEEYFPVILLDVMMPGVGGLELLGIIRKTYPKIQVIMATASSSIDIAEEAVGKGAFAYLTKPAKKEEVIVTVANAMDNHGKAEGNTGVQNATSIKNIIYTLIISDYDGSIRKINSATEKMLGYDANELTGKNMELLFNGNFDYKKFKKINEKDKLDDYDMTLIDKDKGKHPYKFSGTIMNDIVRKTLGFVGMLKIKEETVKSIALIEDDKDYREILAGYIENGGYEVIAVSSGYDIVTEILRKKPDMIIVDIVLPRMEGGDIIGVLRKNDMIENVPVIVISSKDESEIKTVAEEINATAWLQKPVEKEEFISLIKKHLETDVKDE